MIEVKDLAFSYPENKKKVFNGMNLILNEHRIYGLIGGKPLRMRSIVLRQNGIKTRYYGLDKEHDQKLMKVGGFGKQKCSMKSVDTGLNDYILLEFRLKSLVKQYKN